MLVLAYCFCFSLFPYHIKLSGKTLKTCLSGDSAKNQSIDQSMGMDMGKPEIC